MIHSTHTQVLKLHLIYISLLVEKFTYFLIGRGALEPTNSKCICIYECEIKERRPFRCLKWLSFDQTKTNTLGLVPSQKIGIERFAKEAPEKETLFLNLTVDVAGSH